MLLGCIGDDFTGSSDLANTLAKAGMRVVQYNGVPAGHAAVEVEAGVVALKTRTVPVAQAVAESLAALEWLQAQGCRQFYFKYCSTFDSTPEGNIGPVLDALSNVLGAQPVVVCPAFPATGRTVYNGHLFVDDRLLSQSGMANHPLTPMTDPDIRRWLALQTCNSVGHVGYAFVAKGSSAIREALDYQQQHSGRLLIVIDTVDESDLLEIGKAVANDVLISGGSGLAMGLPTNFGLNNLRPSCFQSGPRDAPVVVLCGSCSSRSQEQIALHSIGNPAFCIEADTVISGAIKPDAIAGWVMANMGSAGVPLVYSSADPATVRAAQDKYGRDKVAAALEDLFGELAAMLVGHGITKIIAAGGETSGAIVKALGAEAFEIGPEIDPGVPALRVPETQLWLALKSGNFGAKDFFSRAARVLSGGSADE